MSSLVRLGSAAIGWSLASPRSASVAVLVSPMRERLCETQPTRVCIEMSGVSHNKETRTSNLNYLQISISQNLFGKEVLIAFD